MSAMRRHTIVGACSVLLALCGPVAVVLTGSVFIGAGFAVTALMVSVLAD